MTASTARRRLVILGAAGRDFHNFNVVYCDDPSTEVVAFTATQIPGVAGRRYPAVLAGMHYPDGIPIEEEANLERLCRNDAIDSVVFAYSDVDHAHVMHLASRGLASGADFELLGPHRTMLTSKRPVIAVSAVRTGCGKKEVIDFTLAQAESAAAWETFLGDLIKRGLTGKGLELICVDGGSGLLAALPTAFPGVPIQRCWAHKIRNVLNKVRKADHGRVKADLHAIMNADNLMAARSAARRFADRWQASYPDAVACLRNDLDDLFTCFRYKTLEERKAVRTTNAIERRFVEVRRRTRPMGVFFDRTSMERILFAVFIHENYKQKVSTPFLLTQTS